MLRRRWYVLIEVPLLCFLVLSCVLFVEDSLVLVGAVVDGSVGRAIDVYTNKEPCSGEGPNQDSDAFEPQEEVVLYGLVTYNADPVPGKIVSFDVRGPVNPFENVSLSLSAVTDESGVASVSFIVPWPNPRPQEAILGTWVVVGSVDIAGVVVSDWLSFKGGWLVELLYVKTADLNNELRSSFSRDERMGFRLGVRNIAMTAKTATLVVNAFDQLGAALGVVRVDGESVPPGVKEYFLSDIQIPGSAVTGEGLAVANALKRVEEGVFVPWCPEVEAAFYIGLMRDVAVLDVLPSVREAYSNETVGVTVVVKNKGQGTESFNVSVFYDSVLIGGVWVDRLASGAERSLSVAWFLGSVPPGEYRVKAEAGPVPGEVFLADNVFVDGFVRVIERPGPPAGPGLDMRAILAMLFIVAVLVAALLALVIVMLLACRRGKEDEEDSKGVSESLVLPLYPIKKCRECGKEFPGVYTFCPYCMSFHGKDF